MGKLSSNDIKNKLAKLDAWQLSGQSIKKDFKFSGFEDAIRFIDKLALEATKLNHHPDIYNSYDKVTLILSTHSLSGVSELDIQLAKSADLIAKEI